LLDITIILAQPCTGKLATAGKHDQREVVQRLDGQARAPSSV